MGDGYAEPVDEPSSPRDVMVLSAFEGLACAASATLAVGPDFIAMIDQAFPGRWVPGVARLVFSLAALFTVALCGVRLRPDAPAAEWKLGRTAMMVTVAITLAACTSCAMARWDLFWVVPSCLALLLVGAISVAISPGRRTRHAAIAVASLTLLVLLPFTCWPLRVTVWLWRGSLEELSLIAEQLQRLGLPHRLESARALLSTLRPKRVKRIASLAPEMVCQAPTATRPRRR